MHNHRIFSATPFRGFTLIELLIVVAIIAILAAIAVPNFLEAQTRSKVSRAKADMRTISTGLEAYCIDNNNYPLCPPAPGTSIDDLSMGAVYPWLDRLAKLTTPIAYLASISNDQFIHKTNAGRGMETTDIRYKSYVYSRGDVIPGGPTSLHNKKQWTMNSAGPDNIVQSDSYYTVAEMMSFELLRLAAYVTPARYDPSNGTVSQGDIFVWGPGNQTTN